MRRWILAAFLFICAGCGPIAAATPTPAPTPDTWNGQVIVSAMPKPPAVLTDTSGASFDLRQRTTGRVLLLYFGYTHCPDECPTTMATIANAEKNLNSADRAKIDVVFVTTDPQRDTPSALRQWLDRFNPSFIGLTGTPAQIAEAERSAGVSIAATETPAPGASADQYFVEHAAFVLVYSTDNQAHEAFFSSATAAQISADLHRLASGEIPS